MYKILIRSYTQWFVLWMTLPKAYGKTITWTSNIDRVLMFHLLRYTLVDWPQQPWKAAHNLQSNNNKDKEPPIWATTLVKGSMPDNQMLCRTLMYTEDLKVTVETNMETQPLKMVCQPWREPAQRDRPSFVISNSNKNKLHLTRRILRSYQIVNSISRLMFGQNQGCYLRLYQKCPKKVWSLIRREEFWKILFLSMILGCYHAYKIMKLKVIEIAYTRVLLKLQIHDHNKPKCSKFKMNNLIKLLDLHQQVTWWQWLDHILEDSVKMKKKMLLVQCEVLSILQTTHPTVIIFDYLDEYIYYFQTQHSKFITK